MRVVDSRSVEGDDFSVVVLDIHTVMYSEVDRRATVEIEGGEVEGVIDWLVYAATVDGWEAADSVAPLEPEDRTKILSRVSAALALLGMANKVV